MPKEELSAALFLDFDNIFIGLRNLSPEASTAFVRNIQTWLEWFRAGQHSQGNPIPRRLLVQRCYINPDQLGQHRGAFVRAGFETVDCPALTSQNKNSADIYMALDIVDLLDHRVHIDEFIVLSADADFTPVLHRLRLHDRIATVYANLVTAAAYRNASSGLIDQDRFIAEALGIRPDTVAPPQEAAPQERITDPDTEIAFAARRITEELQDGQTLPINSLGGVLKRQYPPFDGSEWLGKGTLQSLVNALLEAAPTLELRGEVDAREIALRPMEIEDDRARDILIFIHTTIAASATPISWARILSMVKAKFSIHLPAVNYFGAGSAAQFINRQGDGTLRFDPTPPGNVYDPARHELLEGTTGPRAQLEGIEQDLATIIEDISDATGWPALSPDQLSMIFEEGADLVANGVFERNDLSKRIRDAIQTRIDEGDADPRQTVARPPINFILTSVILRGGGFSEADTRQVFAEAAWHGFAQLYELRLEPMDQGREEYLRDRLFGLPKIKQP